MASKTKSRKAYEALSFGSVGLEMGVAVFLGFALGHYLLDPRLGTAPYLTVLFTIFGAAAGFKGLLRATRQAKAAAAESNHQP